MFARRMKPSPTLGIMWSQQGLPGPNPQLIDIILEITMSTFPGLDGPVHAVDHYQGLRLRLNGRCIEAPGNAVILRHILPCSSLDIWGG